MDSSASSSSLPVTTDHNNATLGATTTTTTTTTTTDTTTSSSTNMVIVGILVGLIAILTIILVILLVRPVMEYIKARLPENKRRKELRYRTVEGWVISKRIRPHDEVCAHALEHFAKTSAKNHSETTGDNITATTTSSSSSTLKPCTSYDTAETVVGVDQSLELEWKECPICMEEFKADEIVSWSPDDQTSCLHFFHHECIKEWLLRSPHCPYCRGTIIPVDDCRPNKVDKLTLLEMSKRRARKAATTYCCVEHGLVHLTHKPITNGTTTTTSNPNGPNATKTAKSRWKTRRDKIMWEAVLAPRVTPMELVAKRGGRNESSSSTSLGEFGDNDSELSSVIFAAHGGRPPLTAPSPLWLQPEHVVPPNVLLAELDTTMGAAVLQADQGDMEAPPVSGDLVRIVPSCRSEEQSSSTTTTTSRSRTVGTAADAV